MKNYKNDDLSERKRRMQSKRRAIRRRINLSLLVLGCLAVLYVVIFLGRTSQHNTVEEPESFSVIEPDEQLTDLPAISNDDTINSADEDEWYLILTNKWNPIPNDYEVELTELSNGESVDKRIYSTLQEMFDAAKSDGIYPIVASGFRTTKKQQSLLDEKIADYEIAGFSAEEARAEAETWVAVPGTSEHELGIAVDINADGIHSAGYEVYEWLAQNAHKFGFICRYPSDKTEITGVSYEPWHYRYVGIKAATDIFSQGVCLEEYLNRTN